MAFLENVVGSIGFSNVISKLIMHSISFASLSILWNGEKLFEFSPSRGLHQGDPLSPHLFAFCVEILAQDIDTARVSSL